MANRPYIDQWEIDGVAHDILPYNGNPAIAGYGGNNLTEEFENAAAFHAAVAAGDFSRIHIGDYYPITLNGNYTDFARFTVPSGTTYYSDAGLTTEAGTTEEDIQGEYQSATAIKFKVSGTDVYAAIGDCTPGFEKSMNETLLMEVAAINPYLRMGDTELTAQHVLLCSRDCMANTMQMRCANSVWYDTEAVNPWKGSALHATLNDPDKGVIKLVEATDLGPYVFKGPNNKGMRSYLATMAAGAGSPTAGAWNDRGRLFLPTEREVYGSHVWQANGYEGMFHYNQWPIFRGSSRHIIKGSGNGGGRAVWWEESAGSATSFALVYSSGLAYYNYASYAYRAPLCFLFT